MSRKTRSYVRTRTRRLRKQARTISIPGNPEWGEGEDYGKWYRCWNCGFICNVDRDELGGKDDRDGIVLLLREAQYFGLDESAHAQIEESAVKVLLELGGPDFLGSILAENTINPYGTVGLQRFCQALSNEDDPLLTMAILRTGHVVPRSQADGTDWNIRRDWYPDVAAGCPFCGTKNWRGDHP